MNIKTDYNCCQHHYLMTVQKPALKDGVMKANIKCLRCGDKKEFTVAVAGYNISNILED